MADSSQKFIARNRAPRVQIEYDVELYGAEKKVQLPFVMGVMSDLSGKSTVETPAVSDRKFLEIDVDNFDDRMKAMAPRVEFAVPNTLTGEGNLAVDLTFEKMADFTPAQIASKIEPLRKLLEARTQLSTLMAYMDGKTGAETLIEKVLADPALLGALAGSTLPEQDNEATLDALRDMMPEDAPADNSVEDALASLPEVETAEAQDQSADILSDLAADAPEDAPEDTAVADALSSLPSSVEPEAPVDDSADVLSNLAASAPEEAAQDTSLTDALSSLPETEVTEVADTSGDILAELADAAPADEVEDTAADDILSSLPDVEITAEEDASDDILSDLARVEPDDEPEDTSVADALSSVPEVDLSDVSDDTTDVLADLADAAPETTEVEDVASDILSDLSDLGTEEVEDSSVSDALASLPETDVADEGDGSDDILSDLADSALDIEVEEDTLGDVLASVPEVEVASETDQSDDILSELADLELEETEEDGALDAALSSLPDTDEEVAEDHSDILSDLADAAPEEVDEDVDLDGLLDDLAEKAPDEADEPAAEDILASVHELDSTDETDPLEDILGDLASEDQPDPEAEASDLDDLLADLADSSDEAQPEEDVLDDILGDLVEAEADEVDEADVENVLADLAEEPDGHLDDLLNDLGSDEDTSALTDEAADDLEDLLGDLEETSDDASDDLDALLGDLESEPDSDAASDDLDALLGDLEGGDETEDVDTDDLDALLADLGDDVEDEDAGGDDLDALLNDLGSDDDSPAEAGAADDLDALLADLGDDEGGSDDLDDLLNDLGADEDNEASSDEPTDDLDALLGDLDLDNDGEADDLDALLGDLDADDASDDTAELDDEPQLAFGRMSADRPDPERLKRTRFRIALFGDFSGRAARGQIETGDALAARKPIILDPDTVEEVIEGFATDLVLPIGKDGAGIKVKLKELDDLHPDELYEKVELFDGLSGLKSQLSAGGTADHAAKQLIGWGEEFGQAVVPPRKTSGGNTVRADLKLSDFQKLIGDTSGELAQASPVDDLLKRVVGPHIRKLPSPDVQAMQKAVDEALSAAMRMVLHHPEFQSVEAQWRSLDLIARSVEDDDTLDVVLYDVSAEEIAADLAAEEDLAKTGLVRLLTEEPLDEENGRGGYSALIGLYTFEETPPHAELLGRIGRVAAHVDAPFISAITPAYLDVKPEDRHPLVVDAWDTLRAMPEAGHVGLASPRFLLRRPYGAKSEPIYEFDFEEFTESEGLRGMLWANPAVLVTILLARSFKQNGKAMNLGSVMSLGGIPYHFVNDRYGDQVALPCTERNITLPKHEHSVQRGYMPVLSVKGRDEIRLGSFNSVAGQEILGPWSGMPAPAPSPDVPAAPEADEDGDLDLDLDLDTSDDDDFDLDLDLGDDDSGDLDDLLASFGDDDGGDDSDDDDMDPELAALLNDL
ncbi:type VI secretion system contractile sheath small subunit [Ruegeria sp. R13_0]|nr:type VI secretion system contractile sheath small subunit [Ruegeria sp. R13_0]